MAQRKIPLGLYIVVTQTLNICTTLAAAFTPVFNTKSQDVFLLGQNSFHSQNILMGLRGILSIGITTSIRVVILRNSTKKRALRADVALVSGVLYWPPGPVPPLGPDLIGPQVQAHPCNPIIN